MTGERCDDCGQGLYYRVNYDLGIACDFCGDYHPNGGKPWREPEWITRTIPLPPTAKAPEEES